MTTPNSTTADTRLVTLMVTLVLFSPLAIDIYLPALPAMASAFQVDPTRVQDTVTWFMFSMGLGQLLAGPLAGSYWSSTYRLRRYRDLWF